VVAFQPNGKKKPAALPLQTGTATSHAGSRMLTYEKMEKFMPSRAKLTSMNIALRKSWTHEEFFDWAQSQEIRYEFDGFQPVAMTGGFNNAGAIGVNLLTALRNRLRGSPCRPLGPNNGLETVNKGNSAIRYPDALVTCTKFDGQGRSVPGVILVFEVVGNTPDSIHRDHFEKVVEYATVPSIRKYVIVESANAGLTILERSSPEETWRETFLSAPDDVLLLPEIDIEIPVAEFYEDVTF
jgi:Uma2 family endonuclease